MKQWKDDKRWSDRFIPEIKQHLASVLIQEAPLIEDARRNTDLIVLRMDAIRIACRIRHHKYALKYPHEFTIRAGRPSGAKTELAKLIAGWGDYIFYGFADQSDGSLCRWFIGDLSVFRTWHAIELWRGNPEHMPGAKQSNGDQSSWFMAYDTRVMPPDFVVSSSQT